MTSQEVYRMLCSTGLPVGHVVCAKGTAAPYVVYVVASSPAIASDHVTVGRKPTYRVELYTAHADPAAEALVEGALDGRGIVYDKTPDIVIAEQKLIQTLYEFEEIEVK